MGKLAGRCLYDEPWRAQLSSGTSDMGLVFQSSSWSPCESFSFLEARACSLALSSMNLRKDAKTLWCTRYWLKSSSVSSSSSSRPIISSV